MNKWVPITLWLLVLVLGIWVWNQRRSTVPGENDGPIMEGTSDGKIFIEVPWKHLPTVGDLKLTDQRGEPFSAAAKIGRPFLVNFFFSTCPTICRQFNGQMQELASQFKHTDVMLLSITVDPETDRPDLLLKYADSFLADHERWKFLTGRTHEIEATGQQVFHVPLEKATHTEKIFLVDRWGRIRDWFDWNNAEELSRLKVTLQDVLSETEPPLDKTVRTRYALAGGFADRWANEKWLAEFKLDDADGKKFYSRDMVGQVWLASFFFTSCPKICPQMNTQLAKYQTRLKEKSVPLISITTDSNVDTVAVLKEYSRQYRTEGTDWRFLTGDATLIKRIGSELFTAASGAEHHSTDLFLVDRWGNVRGSFNWQLPEHEVAMWDWIERLQQETRPPSSLQRVHPPVVTPALDEDANDE
ncbi:MAG: SCO family protein [Planctomycetaceae bacterium]|nr:SCO family protein [Planctomycetaceae bacterium]